MVNSSDSVSPREKRPDGERSLGLAHENAGRDVGGFGAACAHHPLHHNRHGAHQNLHHAEVVKDAEQAGYKDDDGQHLKREDYRLAAAQLVAKYESAAGEGVADERIHFVASRFEDKSGGGAQDDEREGEL